MYTTRVFSLQAIINHITKESYGQQEIDSYNLQEF